MRLPFEPVLPADLMCTEIMCGQPFQVQLPQQLQQLLLPNGCSIEFCQGHSGFFCQCRVVTASKRAEQIGLFSCSWSPHAESA